MKPFCSKRRNHGLTLLEVVVVILVLAIVTLMLIPANHSSQREAMRISCVNNLKESDLAFRIWEGDNHDLYPMAVARTNGGAMEQAAIGNATAVFKVMSNELSDPRILICPADEDRVPATNFSAGFSAKNLSYFVGVNASEANPRRLLAGDDNFEVGGVPVKSGPLELTTNQPISWSAARHKFCGNVALTDGSIQQITTPGLQLCLSLATNRIAIP